MDRRCLGGHEEEEEGASMKLTTNRTLYCYLALTLWIFIVVAGLYRFMYRDALLSTPHPASRPTLDSSILKPFLRSGGPVSTKRVAKLCNEPDRISVGSEGDVHTNYTLEGVVVLFRHGDRGPLSHVRNISSIHCSGHYDPMLPPYWSYLQNASRDPDFLRFLGPFQTFPLAPEHDECALGQLTRLGVSQLLRTGEVLREAYRSRLPTWPPVTVTYSTRYRRTFQSALAFLYALLGPAHVTMVALRESQALSFCFDDCVCPAIESLRRRFNRNAAQYLRSHPAVHALVRSLAAAIFDHGDHASDIQNPRVVEDALLAYLCHNAPLPCVTLGTCINMEHVNNLLAYNEWESKQHVKSKPLVRSFVLQSYGLVRNILQHLLRMMSDADVPRVIAYSGHDKTMQYLMFSMGVSDGSLPPYASRLVVELYRHGAASHPDRFYFRVVYNGRDVTSRVAFCRRTAFPVMGDLNIVAPDERRRQAYLCRIENIVRFLHDDYFQLFNGTNFKDVCFPNGFAMPTRFTVL